MKPHDEELSMTIAIRLTAGVALDWDRDLQLVVATIDLPKGNLTGYWHPPKSKRPEFDWQGTTNAKGWTDANGLGGAINAQDLDENGLDQDWDAQLIPVMERFYLARYVKRFPRELGHYRRYLNERRREEPEDTFTGPPGAYRVELATTNLIYGGVSIAVGDAHWNGSKLDESAAYWDGSKWDAADVAVVFLAGPNDQSGPAPLIPVE